MVRGGGTVDIKDNVLEDYQKNGIVIQNAGTTAEIKRNTVVGAGVTDIIGQNGIQMSGGAEGAIQDNDVRDHVYEDTGQVVATGVLLFGVDSITVQKNSLTNTEIGVASQGATIESFEIVSTRVVTTTGEYSSLPATTRR
ncbi:right-handed parallel beta-helix repeat-containing protein [Halomicroarcula sp. GCM10025710]